MCGLVGIAGDLQDPHYKIFRILSLIDTIRGHDSFGIARVPVTSDKPIIAKELGTPYDLFLTSKQFCYNNYVVGSNKVVIGHNRSATIGEVNAANAHPFTFGNITGAHNGTLRDWRDLHNYCEHDVDSKGIFDHINEHGAEDCWSNFTGAAALTWWDEKSKTLNLVRNKERPLSIATVEDGKVLLWASEAWMLKAAVLCVPGMKLDEKAFNVGAPFSLKEHSLHTIGFAAKTHKPYLKEVKELTPKKEVLGYRGYAGFSQYSSNFKGYNTTPKGINYGWAKGIPKAGKETVGTRFKIKSSLVRYHRTTGESSHLLIGRTVPDDVLVEVYPETMLDWQDLSKIPYDKEHKEVEFCFERRPRVQDGGPPTGKRYMISFENVAIADLGPEEDVVYIDSKNQETTREIAERDLWERSGCTCSLCMQTLEPEDDYEFIYDGWGVKCWECEENKVEAFYT